MADIICARCGEPWEGRLHASSMEMEIDQFENLVNGKSCPCCGPEPILEALKERYLSKAPVALEAWRQSIDRASEGETFFAMDKEMPDNHFIVLLSGRVLANT